MARLTRQLWLVPPDVEFVALDRLSATLAKRILGRQRKSGEGRFLVYRPSTRKTPKLIDAPLKRLLDIFTIPTSLPQAMLRLSRAQAASPEVISKKIMPIFRRLTDAGLLLTVDAPQPCLPTGSFFAGCEVSTCVRPTLDFEIYRAKDSDGRPCALKAALRRTWRAVREGDALRRLKGTAAVKLIKAGETGGRRYLILEWLDGTSVEKRAAKIRRSGLSRREKRLKLLQLVIGCAEALSSVHVRGWLHGNIHPQNFVMQGNVVRLINFDSAQRVGKSNGSCISTFPQFIPYAPPECAAASRRGKDRFRKSFQSEVYSLGVVAYQVLTGRYPTSSLDLPRRDQAVRAVVRKALRRRPDARLRSADAFARALSRCVSR